MPFFRKNHLQTKFTVHRSPFLTLTGNEHITVSIDENLVAEDKRWDGLKGYITNADLKEQVET